MPEYTLSVNGKILSAEADAGTPLLWVLRGHLNLVGTKFGCGVAQCGACTVHVNGQALCSCVFPVSVVRDRKIVTVEGLTHIIRLVIANNPVTGEDRLMAGLGYLCLHCSTNSVELFLLKPGSPEPAEVLPHEFNYHGWDGIYRRF